MANNVVATREQLLKFKKRLKSVNRGYSLLKDKRDSLIQRFITEYKETVQLRREFNEYFQKVLSVYEMASSELSEKYLSVLAEQNGLEINIKKELENILGMKMPMLSTEVKGEFGAYSYLETNQSFDLAVQGLENSIEKIVKLAEKETRIRLLAKEIDKTKKRVNALEYEIIPSIENNIKYINNKLDEEAIMQTSNLIFIKNEIIESDK